MASVASATGVEADFRLDGEVVAPDRRVAAVRIAPPELASAHLLPGAVREALLSSGDRRGAGVHHTPFAVAAAIVELSRSGGDPMLVADPCVGGGVFLLAAAESIGGSRADAVGRLVGCDIDPLAVATTEAAITLWSGGTRPRPGAIRVADFLAPDPFDGCRPDLIVGNPPFLSQLKNATARDDQRRVELRRRWPDLGGYVDESMLFLLAACEVVADDGIVGLIQPTSVLAARDGAPGRVILDETAPPIFFWWSGERVFDAAVDTCAIVCRKGASDQMVGRSVGVPVVAAASCERPGPASWAPLLAGVKGTPEVSVDGPALSSMADVTAGFRDQYYGLRGAVVEDPGGSHPLITCGLIDPLESRWGRSPCRFDRRKWQAPAVMVDEIETSVRDWFLKRLKPKLLVATQTKLIEVVVDPDGSMIPCTPVVVIEPRDPDEIWHLAAALTAPVISALVVASATGSGQSADAIRVGATALANVSLPPAGPAWDLAAEAVREVHFCPNTQDRHEALMKAAVLCDAAYGVDDDALLEWWVGRLPHLSRRIQGE